MQVFAVNDATQNMLKRKDIAPLPAVSRLLEISEFRSAICAGSWTWTWNWAFHWSSDWDRVERGEPPLHSSSV